MDYWPAMSFKSELERGIFGKQALPATTPSHPLVITDAAHPGGKQPNKHPALLVHLTERELDSPASVIQTIILNSPKGPMG